MDNIERKRAFDEEWAARHKDEIEKINAEAERLRKNRRIQKIRKKFLEEKENQMVRINYNQVQNELTEKKTNFKSILHSITIKNNPNTPYFEYDKDMEFLKRLS